MPHPFSNEFSQGNNKPSVKFREIVERALYRQNTSGKNVSLSCKKMHKTSGIFLLLLFKALKDSHRLQVWIKAQVKWFAENTMALLSKGSIHSSRFTTKVPNRAADADAILILSLTLDLRPGNLAW